MNRTSPSERHKVGLVAKTDGDFLRAPQEKKESPGPISNEAKVPLTPYSFSLKKKARRERVRTIDCKP